MTGATIDLAGMRFNVPSPLTAVHDERRLAVAILTGGAVRIGQGLLEHGVSVGAVDLGLVRAGRAPLLEEHFATLDHMVGRVLTAEVEGPLITCLVEFAPGELADRLLGLLRAGFPLSLSVGAVIQHAEAAGDGLYRATRWKLVEISVVPFGKDENAYMRELGRDDDVAGMVARMAPPPGDAGRQAARRALCLDRWTAWGRIAGVTLAAELGLDHDRVCDLLEPRVAAHCDELERDFRP